VADKMVLQKSGEILNSTGNYEKHYRSILNKPVLNSKKEIEFIVHHVEDVTPIVEIEKGSEETLRSNEKGFKGIFDRMLEGVQIIDFNWRYVYVNDSVAKHGRYTKEELTGSTMMERYPGIENSEVFKVMQKCMNDRKAKHFENEFTFPDNSKGWFELSIQAAPEGLVVLSIDISERKKAEEEIRKLNEELEKKINERTSQLQAVNKELESFSYSVSHDLRAPLRAVDGYSKIIEEEYSGSLDDEGRRLLGVVQYNARKMGDLIDDLLAFSRLGKKELQKTTIDMIDLTEGAIMELSKLVEHKAEIKIQKLDSVKADYSLMNQVMVNLISNAIKYSSKKEKSIVEISSTKKDGEIVFTIKDNGVGFDMLYVHKLFGVFQRLHTSEEFDGTGVGLAIVHRIINKHGGKIWAEGKVGESASFHFSLPEELAD